MFGYKTSLISILFIVFVTIVVSKGSKSMNKANYIFTAAKLILILIMLVVAMHHFDSKNTDHILNPSKGAEGIL